MTDAKPIVEIIEVSNKEAEVQIAKPKLSALEGKLSSETADAMIEFDAISRRERGKL